jgi:hypothetical protein
MTKLFSVPLPWRHQQVPGTNITIDYKGTQLTQALQNNIRTAVLNMRVALKKVNDMVSGVATRATLPTKYDALFAQFFEVSTPVTQAQFDRVKRKVAKTFLGLSSKLTLAAIVRWRGGNTATQGYVRGSEGRIHISLSEYNAPPSAEQQTIIVHEATHKFASTDDNAYWRLATNSWDILLNPTTAWDTEMATKNADSYAYFIERAARV